MPYDVDAGPSVPRRGRRPAFNPAGLSGPAPARWRAVTCALLGGILAALLGTALHAQVLRLGELALPVGAVAALVLTGSVITWCGLWARNVLIAALSGGTAYVVVALVSLSTETLILTGIEGPGPEPAAVLAGNIWMFGLAVATIAGIAVCGAALRGHRSGGSAPTGG